jgi:hypothetical protein
LLAGPLESRSDLAGVHGPRPGSGRSDAEFWQAGDWFLKSRSTRVYGKLTDATTALDALFAVKRALGELAPARSILAVAAGEAGSLQLWTIAPRLVTLREGLDAANRAADWVDFARVLAGFGLALGESLACSIDGGLCLDPNPANFAVQGGRVRYIDDDVARSRDAIGIEDAFVARFAEYAAAPSAVWDGYVARFVRELALRVSPRERTRLRLVERLRAAARLRRASGPYIDRVLAEQEALS